VESELLQKEIPMSGKRPTRQPFLLDARKVKRVQRILGAKTETEAIEQALDVILTNERIDRAHERFVKSGGVIHDTLGRLSK
jgi:hypothetical protein